MIRISRIFVAMSLILIAIVAYGMTVKTDWDTSYDFSKLKTFAFAKQHRGPDDPLSTNTLVNDRIRKALESQLEEHGYQYQPSNPDFLIAYTVSSKERMQIEDFSYGFPGRWRWGFGPDIWTRYYTEGSAVFDFIDPSTKKLIWRGMVTDTVQTGPKDSEKQIDKGAEELVKHFMKDISEKKK